MSETNPLLFEVIGVDGAIEKRDPNELISYGEMQTLNEEFLAFLEERGFGFGGVMRGLEPSPKRRQTAGTLHSRPIPPPQSKDPGVRVSEGGRPVPMPTEAVHQLEPLLRRAPLWLEVGAPALVLLVFVVGVILLLVL